MKRRTLIALALFAMSAGCGTPGIVAVEPGYSAAQDVTVPPGYLPPPGMCRIWYPDRPPGQQPDPGDCEELRFHVPRGTALIRG